MPFQHIQTEQHIHRLFFKHRERCGEEILFNSHLHHVYTANDALNANTFGNTRPSGKI